MAAARELKNRIIRLLADEGWEAELPALAELGQKAVSPLFSALCNASPLVRWRAVTAFGVVVKTMAATTPEKARIIMRRFIWSLNDESGGIGWGAPEAMAEIICQSPLMAAEYHNHILAYIHDDHCRPDCYLEHTPFRRGAVWGVGRMAQLRPDLAVKAEADLLCLLADCDKPIQGLAAWSCGLLGLTSSLPLLQAISTDQTTVELYCDRRLLHPTLATLAGKAISRITGASPATS